MKLHERHNITLDANLLVSKACTSFDTFEQLCALYSMLILNVSEEVGDDIDQIPNIVDLNSKRGRSVKAAVKNIEKSKHWKKLTFGEKLSVVAESMATNAKYLIREERHGNTTTPGGLTSEQGE